MGSERISRGIAEGRGAARGRPGDDETDVGPVIDEDARKASGNTREGPAYAVREFTEERLVVLQL